MNAVLPFDSARGRRASGPELSRGGAAAVGSTIISFRPTSRPAPVAPQGPAVPVPAPVRTAEPDAEFARPAPRERLARLIHMASVGGYIAVRNDTLVELDGRMVWPTAESLIRDAAAAGVPVSTHVIDTSRS